MRSFLRPLLVISIVLLIPIVPFLLIGEPLEAWFLRWRDQSASPGVIAAVIVALLATDILLPIPSSMVSTFGGGALGTWGGTLASWTGMSVGAVLAFGLARQFGSPVVRYLGGVDDVRRLKLVSERYGPLALVLARGVPVFAEASVLLLGIHRLSWRRFLPPLLLSNLGIAVAYSAFGTFAARHAWLPMALGISVALPLAFTAAARFWLPGSAGQADRDATDTHHQATQGESET